MWEVTLLKALTKIPDLAERRAEIIKWKTKILYFQERFKICWFNCQFYGKLYPQFKQFFSTEEQKFTIILLRQERILVLFNYYLTITK